MKKEQSQTKLKKPLQKEQTMCPKIRMEQKRKHVPKRKIKGSKKSAKKMEEKEMPVDVRQRKEK
jgi:hypothetical protein